MVLDWKFKNYPANTSLKENLTTDTTWGPCLIWWDTRFKRAIHKMVETKQEVEQNGHMNYKQIHRLGTIFTEGLA